MQETTMPDYRIAFIGVVQLVAAGRVVSLSSLSPVVAVVAGRLVEMPMSLCLTALVFACSLLIMRLSSANKTQL
jgi:hypothetical protein